MTKREATKPTVDFPLSEASEELTGYETIALEKKFGKMDTWGAGTIVPAFVWAFEKRTDPNISFDDITKRTNRELKAFFAPEPEFEDDESPKYL